MPATPKSFDHLLGGKLKISDKQLEAHLTLYKGYVAKLNEIEEKLAKADPKAVNYSYAENSELKRRHPVAYNGTLLHELYFGNLAPAGTTKPDAALKKLIGESYGSLDNWTADMKAAGMSAHGWALTVWDPRTKKLATNLVQSEHHVGLMADTRIVVALDVWEHAFMIDFGIKKPDYLTAFFENLDWNAFGRRVENARQSIAAAAGAAR